MEFDYIKHKIVSKLQFSNSFDVSSIKELITYAYGYIWFIDNEGGINSEYVRLENINTNTIYILTNLELAQDIIYLPNNGVKKYGKIIHKNDLSGIYEVLMLIDDELVYDELSSEWYDEFIKPDYTNTNLKIIDEI